MTTDPFSIKRYSKLHPIRLAFNARARLIEQEAKWNFKNYALSEKIIPNLPHVPHVDWSNTAVTPLQMQNLLYALSITEHLNDTVIVEVGCYRGATTKCLASATSRKIIAVDPFIGYGGSDKDYEFFSNNISGLSNVVHERKTSGEAIKNWNYGSVSLIFIDALHDYVNTAFDIEAWSRVTTKGAVLAMHDTDQICFAGTRKAVYDAYKSMELELLAHPNNLTLLRK
ncbi:MAG: class I SAM-dependent methyltransferase [Calothrix sp. MO_167.B42]|nr:class I SAM-dependent methyltransferase [Calothrix sp. MO_167.B42]